jgi:tRNA(fMet)-specific endonuclease VapC
VTGYLLDTNVLSEVLKKDPDVNVLRRLEAVPAEQLHTSAVCVMELRFGAARHASGRRLWLRIQREVLSRVNVLPVDTHVAEHSGEILASLEEQGQRIGAEDVMIAATARAHGLAVVTRNVRRLARVAGLRVENWWQRE